MKVPRTNPNRSKTQTNYTETRGDIVGRRKRNANSDPSELQFIGKTYELPAYESEEALENAMISAATRLAFQQLMDGTASSQVIVHYLKLGSTKERIEQDILRKQSQLIDAKTEAIKDQKKSDKIYEEALNAFRRYHGEQQEVDPDENLL